MKKFMEIIGIPRKETNSAGKGLGLLEGLSKNYCQDFRMFRGGSTYIKD